METYEQESVHNVRSRLRKTSAECPGIPDNQGKALETFRESQSLGFLGSCVNFTPNMAKSARLSFREGGARGGPRRDARAGRSHETLSTSSRRPVSDEVRVRNGSDSGVFRDFAGRETEGGSLRHA